MKINMKFKEPDFFALVEKLLPLAAEHLHPSGEAAGKLVSMLSHLPVELMRPALEALPREDICELAALLVKEQEGRLLSALNSKLADNSLDISLSGLSLSKELELCLSADAVDYDRLIAVLLPKLGEKLPGVFSSLFTGSSAARTAALAGRMPESVKEKLLKSAASLAFSAFAKKLGLALEPERVSLSP